MTNIQSAQDQDSNIDSAELPRPEIISASTSAALPRPVASVSDSGRIKFGAACRILQK